MQILGIQDTVAQMNDLTLYNESGSMTGYDDDDDDDVMIIGQWER